MVQMQMHADPAVAARAGAAGEDLARIVEAGARENRRAGKMDFQLLFQGIGASSVNRVRKNDVFEHARVAEGSVVQQGSENVHGRSGGVRHGILGVFSQYRAKLSGVFKAGRVRGGQIRFMRMAAGQVFKHGISLGVKAGDTAFTRREEFFQHQMIGNIGSVVHEKTRR